MKKLLLIVPFALFLAGCSLPDVPPTPISYKICQEGNCVVWENMSLPYHGCIRNEGEYICGTYTIETIYE